MEGRLRFPLVWLKRKMGTKENCDQVRNFPLGPIIFLSSKSGRKRERIKGKLYLFHYSTFLFFLPNINERKLKKKISSLPFFLSSLYFPFPINFIFLRHIYEVRLYYDFNHPRLWIVKISYTVVIIYIEVCQSYINDQ